MPSWRGANALYIARKLGLSTGLQLCLDAGDDVSLPAASATWNDLSDNGHVFDLATPSINGTAGQLVAGNYLGFGGTDDLNLNTTNPAWVNRMHQNNAIFSMLLWFYSGSTGTQEFIASSDSAAGNGFTFRSTSGGQLQLSVLNTGSNVRNFASGVNGDILNDVWNFCALSLDEANDTRTLIINSKVGTGVCSYTSPAAGDAAAPLHIGSRTGTNPIRANGRMAMVAIWEGRKLTLGELQAYREATRPRFGV